MFRCYGAAFAVLLATGCGTVGPDYARPELATPPAWSAAGESLTATPAALDAWWERFEDPRLTDLVLRAMEANLELRVALDRVAEARAARGVVGADLVPRIDVRGDYSRRQNGRETVAGGFGPRRNDLFSFGFDASWELDLWGRVRRGVEAADAEVEVAIEDARDVLVTVGAEVALNYVEMRLAQGRRAIAAANVENQQAALELARDRFSAGLVSELDVAQAGANLERTVASLPTLEIAERAARHRIAVLLGEAPGALETELAAFAPVPTPPLEIAVGVPADLLRRRPDLRRAERELAAATARIGVAEGALYPRFDLLGSLGVDAQDAGDLFGGRAVGFSIGPSIRWNVFDRERLLGGVAIEESRTRQTLARYERSLLGALEEAENAMIAFLRDRQSREALGRALEHARRADALSRDQYRQGLVSFQSVVDSQSRRFEIEDTLALAAAAISLDAISMYKALGGGWESHDLMPAAAPEEENAR
ncbi:MAG: efflux transporter outer membrane subunit [Planctomycetota bacterium]